MSYYFTVLCVNMSKNETAYPKSQPKRGQDAERWRITDSNR